jgi:hypothetical protein
MTLNRKQLRGTYFKEGTKDKMPMVTFGDGTHNRDHIRFKGHMHGITDKIYGNLQRLEKLGELLLLDINKFRTSVLSVAVQI